MHYYQFNIADYQSHTKHLTPIEDICYRRLLDWQYLHEKPIPRDLKSICRLLILREHQEDVEQILNEFFVLTDEGWVNHRVFEEIDGFREKSKKASDAGKASAAKRLSKKNSASNNRSSKNQQTLNGCSTDVEPTNNHKPRTINQEPLTNTVKTHAVDNSQRSREPTQAGNVCAELKKIGIIDVNPAHPKLLELLRVGATVDEFVYAARTAKDKKAGFAYVIGVVEGQRKDAKAMHGALHEGRMPNKQEILEQSNAVVAKNWVPPEIRVKAND